ncbi:MAG: hypothetical protein ABI972_26695 [Acidobacteriota bacterium]
MLIPLLLFASAAHTVARDATPLRAACDSSSETVAQLNPGDTVDIRYALASDSGPCYKVSAGSGGKQWEGWLPASALTNLEEFEKARTSAAQLNQATPEAAPAPKSAAAYSLPAGQNARLLKVTQLLNANQPAEALSVTEAILKEQGPEPDLLALAGVAAQRSDQPAQAIQFWEQSLALKKSPALERMIAGARREVESDQSSEKLYGMRFLFRYDTREITPDQARSIVPMLDSEFSRLSEILGCRSDERIVVVVQSIDAFRKTTGSAEWAGGQYDGRIRVALLDGGRMGEDTRRAFAHEIVHACIANLGSFPAWLHEGLAQKLSGEVPAPADLAMVKQMARQNTLPSLGRLSGTWSRLSPQHARVAYAAAYIAADALVTAYGADGARNLLHNEASLPQVAADLDRRVRQ